MVAIPTLEDEDARRPSRGESLVGERTRIINRMKAILAWLGVRGFNPKLRKAPQRLDDLRTPEDLPLPPNTVDELRRDMARLAMVCEQIKALEQARLADLERAPGTGPHAMVRLIANVIGVGIETADMLVQEVLSRNLRDRRAVARFAGLTGAPNESGSRRREGVGEVRQCPGEARVDQLAWRFLRFQKDSALAQWYRARTERSAATRVKMIVALARLLIAFTAHGHRRRNPSRLRVAPAGLRRSARKLKQAVRRPLGFSRMAIDDPSGADPDGRLAPTPQGEWARRLGALPPKRMVASWSGSSTDPTGYKDAAQCCPRRRTHPSDLLNVLTAASHYLKPKKSGGAMA